MYRSEGNVRGSAGQVNRSRNRCSNTGSNRRCGIIAGRIRQQLFGDVVKPDDGRQSRGVGLLSTRIRELKNT